MWLALNVQSPYAEKWCPGMSDRHGSMVQRLIETDHAGRVLYATPEAAELLGSSRRAIVGQDLSRLFGKDGRIVREHLRKLSLGQPVEVIRTKVLAANQTSIPV